MTRVMAFSVVFFAGTACHLDVKKSSTLDDVKTEQVVTETVTTAPTERVTEKWHFSITPGIGRALPGGGPALPPDAPARAGFTPSPGLGYALDEYERVTEHLEPVAKTKTTANKNETLKTTGTLERETDVGPGWKFYIGVGLGLGLVLLGSYAYLKFDWKTLLSSLLKKVLP
jgi:hypothetical protein